MRVLRCLITGNFLDTYHFFRILKLVFDVYFCHCLLGNICLSVICVAIKRNLAPESILSQANLASESILSQIEFCLLKHFIPNRILSLKAFCPKQNLNSEVILITNRVSTIESIIETNRNFALKLVLSNYSKF